MARKQDLRDHPRSLLEYMLEQAWAEGRDELARRIEEALPLASDVAIDHRGREYAR